MVTLRASTDADVELEIALETDPVAMAELGGPREEAAVRKVHARRMTEPFWFIVCEDEEPVGTIGAWQEGDDEAVGEVGWMVLPAAQGRGLASAALGLLIEAVRAAGTYASLHAYPGVTNAPSNRLCEKHGFTLIGAFDGEFAGNTLRLNHWRLDL